MKRIVVVLFAAALSATACGSERDTVGEPVAAPPTTKGASSASTTTGSCVERYSIETLKRRDYAFDGTIASIDAATDDGPDTVVFDVGRWFKGGSGAEATRKAYGFGAVTSAGSSPRAVGDRLLVAGEDDFIWECGFTQRYDAKVAEDWDTAL